MITRVRWCLMGCMTIALTWAAPARGDIIDIDPFVGAKSEDLENVKPPPPRIERRIDVFEGDVTFVSLVNQTTIHFWFGSCLNGNCARPRSPSFLIGATTKYAIMFNTPFRRFGSYFTNNSLADDFEARFYDADGNLLETRLVRLTWRDEDWHWLGWESDVPIGRMDIRSKGVLEGFIWLDDLELTAAAVECDPCDTNCDGSVDLTDVEPFIGLMLGRDEPCSDCAGDANSDGSVDLTDVEDFLACLLG